MASWVKYRHKKNHRIKYWARRTSTLARWEIRATKNAYYDDMEKPPELCLPGGTFPAQAIFHLYERVKN